jgi:hypothetical protein
VTQAEVHERLVVAGVVAVEFDKFGQIVVVGDLVDDTGTGCSAV